MSIFDVIFNYKFGTRLPESNMDASNKWERANLQLQRALMSFRGHASCAFLGEIYRVAVEQTGFEGSLEEAAEALAGIPGVRLERAPVLDQSCVYASAYWSRKI